MVAGERDGREDELLLLAGREDFVQVDWDAQGDEEEPADARPDPVGWLEGRWGDELRPQREASVG